MNDVKQQVGGMIREARKAKGMTQKELGEKLGVSSQAIGKYELGQNLTLDTLARIGQEVGMKVSDLVKGV